MKKIFVNPETAIIRAGWRILLFVVMLALLNFGFSFTIREILGSLRGGSLLSFIILGGTATIAAFITRRYLEKDRIKSMGLSCNALALKDIGVGVVISALVMVAMYYTLKALGFIQFDGYSWWSDSNSAAFSTSGLIVAASVFAQFTIVAWWEELAFRGVILQNLSKGLGLVWGIVISTLLFGLIHAGNPNATIVSTTLIFIITIKLVYAYLKTGQLWLPVGLHLGWNFFQASVFGFASSGHESPSLIAQHAVGPDWLSGGAFGAENSVFIIPYTLCTLLIIHFWVKASRKQEKAAFFTFTIQSKDFQ